MKPYEFVGRLKKVTDTETIQGKKGEFKKRHFTVEANSESQYPTVMYFELQNSHTGDIEGFRVGQELKVEFYVDCRSWTNPQGKTLQFVTLRAVGVHGVRQGRTIAEKMPDVPNTPTEEVVNDDNLPF